MPGLLARTFFQVCGNLGPAQLFEPLGGAPKISRCVDRRVIGAHECDDITRDRRIWACSATFDPGKSEIDGCIKQPDRAARRAVPGHRLCEWIDAFFRAVRTIKPDLSRLASDDRNIALELNPLRDWPRHSTLRSPSAAPDRHQKTMFAALRDAASPICERAKSRSVCRTSANGLFREGHCCPDC